jgi:hypothetical protein
MLGTCIKHARSSNCLAVPQSVIGLGAVFGVLFHRALTRGPRRL